MAFAASALSGLLNRKWSIGPVKIEIQTFSALTSDTTGTVTANALTSVDACILIGSGTLCQTSAPSVSGTTATLAFADPAAACTGYVAKAVNGYVLLIGR